MKSEIKKKFLELNLQVNNLQFSAESIVELGAIKLEAERYAKTIIDNRLRKFCLNELDQLKTDEFSDMYNNKNKNSFESAKSELSFILKDCSNGKLNSK